MGFNAGLGAGIATGAVIKVKHKDALSLVKALFRILVEDAMTYGRAI